MVMLSKLPPFLLHRAAVAVSRSRGAVVGLSNGNEAASDAELVGGVDVVVPKGQLREQHGARKLALSTFRPAL